METKIDAHFHQQREGSRADRIGKFLVALSVGPERAPHTNNHENKIYADAVMDDFGSLVVVSEWR